MRLVKSYFSYIRQLMMVIGIWRIEGEGWTISMKLSYRIYSIVIQLICSSGAVSTLAAVPALIKNNSTVILMDNVGRLMVFVVIIYKMFVWQSNPMLNLLRVALKKDSQLVHQTDSKIQKIYQSYMNYGNKIVIVVLLSAILMGVAVSIHGVINCYTYLKEHRDSNLTEKPLPLNLWYPFDKNKYYTLILVDQNIRSMFTCVSIGIVGASVNSFVIFINLRLVLLQHYFRYVEKFNDSNEVQVENKVEENLRLLCLKHQELIEFVENFKETVKNVVLLEYMISSLTIAIIVLQIIASSQLALNVAMLAYLALQLLIFAWNCNEIMVQSTELANALYESNWYDQGKLAKDLLRMMMIRCRKPLRLRIGFFGPMDLEAGVSRLKLGYSYTTLVKN